jgi:2-polyprenyl-3-methyl-5-hydroxy-6-metoxy-1,4-benzoquinol methylase
MTERPVSLPTLPELDLLFRQKYGDPATVGWSPRRRHRFGYFLPSDIYEALVSSLTFERCSWVDIGGGHNIFPENPGLARMLVARCATVVAVDPSANVLKNAFTNDRVQRAIEDYATNRRFDLATLRMVAEHIADPDAFGQALSRLVEPGGLVVVFTVNRWSPLTILSALTPLSVHHALKRVFWGTAEEDTFPVQYRMNTRKALRGVFKLAGFDEVFFAYLDDLSTWSRFRRMNYLEHLGRVACRGVGLPYPENCLLGVYRKKSR